MSNRKILTAMAVAGFGVVAFGCEEKKSTPKPPTPAAPAATTPAAPAPTAPAAPAPTAPAPK